MESFYRRVDQGNCWWGEERIIFRPEHLHVGGREHQGFLSCKLSVLSMEDGEGPHDRLPVGHKIPAWLITIMFLVEVETAVRLGIKSGFGILSLGTSDAILGLWFSL